jgi:hypothetical protein
MAGVVVDGTWHPLVAGTQPPDVRTIQAGLVDVESMPPVVAPEPHKAVAVARWVAVQSGRPVWRVRGRLGARTVTLVR